MNKNDITTHFKCPWIELKSRPFDSSGDPYYYLDLPDYVCIFTLLNKDEVLIVQQYRATIDKTTFELPAGLVEKGETPEQTAIRECREETGYEPRNLKLLYKGHVDPGRLNNTQYIYFSEDLTHNPLPKPEMDLVCKKMKLSEIQNSLESEAFNSTTFRLAWLLVQNLDLAQGSNSIEG